MGTGATETNARSAGRPAIAGLGLSVGTTAAIVVDLTITIIVDLIATIFFFGSYFTLAGTPLTVLT